MPSWLAARPTTETRSDAPAPGRGVVRIGLARVAAVQTLLRTPLYERHVAAGARLVPFAGWEMPVQYEGVAAEHRAVRGDCGVFDVSHMGELHVEGPNAEQLLQALLANDLGRIGDGEAQYTLLTNDSAGILDDLIAYRFGPHHFLLVVNASNREVDHEWLKEREIRGSEVRDASDDYAMLAVQGPRALERLGLAEAPSFTFVMGELDGIECLIARTGYTGEAGVELICPAEDGPALWDAVVERGAVPCGLGARDTLRLEMCFPLHGNDITPATDPVSAGLGWACALDKQFTGVEELRRIKQQGPEQRLVPFVMEDRAVPRQGMLVEGGGEVTSGTHSPMLDRGIGMAYVPAGRAEPDTELVVDVRGRPRRARIVKKPIYKRS
jgi:aminomethyltransferase